MLFADIATSTELIRGLDPEEALALLDSGLHLMIEAVHRYEGTVSRVMGDGIVALFGAPLSEEDHAVRACYAALTMQAMFAREARAGAAESGVALSIRVGLHSGEVVVRALETDLATDYSAVGLTTHLAARMEQTALPGTVQLTAETTRLVEGYVEVRPRGSVEVKGLAEPVATFELLGASAAHTRLQIAAARGLAPLVGRQAELDVLRRALERAGSGEGQVVALVGEPGVGKSRLIWEVVHSDLTAGWTVLDTSAVAYGRATPYRPLADLIRAHVRIEAADDVEAIRDKVTAWLLTPDRRRASLLAPLLELLDVPVDPSASSEPALSAAKGQAAWRSLSPAQRRRRTIDACLSWLLLEAERQPLVLVVEDLHWIDTETQAVLDGLVESLGGARLLLLVNYRPEYRHEWTARGCYTEVRVEPLPTESADSLLTSLLGDDPGLRPIKQLLIERTEGVPFFIEECVRMLGGRDGLRGGSGGRSLAAHLADLAVPDSVQAILAARIDRLPAEEKLLLQSAAVIGKDVPLALLREVAGLTDDALKRALVHLQETALLYEARRFPDVAYTFTHSLTQSVAYESVLLSRRRALHARLVDEIERLYAGRLAEQVERLAQHALRGEVWERAVTYCQEAGLKAARRSASREASSHFERALGALRRLPASRANSELAVDLIVELGRALHPIGEHQRCLDLFREASALAEGLADRRRLARSATLASRALFFLGRYGAAIDAGQQTLEAAEALGDLASQTEARSLIAQAASHRGDFRQAAEQYRWVLAATEPGPDHETADRPWDFRALWQGFLAWCLAWLGELAEARRLGDEAIRMGEAGDQPYATACAMMFVGDVHFQRGDPAEAVRVIERGLELARAFDFALLTPTLISWLGHAYSLLGRGAEGLRLLEEGVQEATTSGIMAQQSLKYTRLGAAYLRVGRIDDAERAAQQAIEIAVGRDERAFEGWARLLHGDAAGQAERVDVDGAAARYREALAIAVRLGMRPLEAHCHRGLGTLFRRAGRDGEARAETTAALDLYRSMGASEWLRQAEAEAPHAGDGPRE